MKQLANKHILLCVTGGIAAYKAAEIIRLFKSSGSNVRVLMTKAAQEFITPLTMQALSGNQVHVDLLDTEAEAAMGHIELAKWSDVILIAPCSANSISRLAAGKGDDLMTAVCLAAESKIFFDLKGFRTLKSITSALMPSELSFSEVFKARSVENPEPTIVI